MLFKGNSSKLELLIEKIQANKENGPDSETGSVANEEVSVGGSSWDVGSDGRGSLSPASSATPTSASETDVEAAATVGVTQTTPYQCSFCDRAFPRLSYLKRHEQLHGLKTDHWPTVTACSALHVSPASTAFSSPSLLSLSQKLDKGQEEKWTSDCLGCELKYKKGKRSVNDTKIKKPGSKNVRVRVSRIATKDNASSQEISNKSNVFDFHGVNSLKGSVCRKLERYESAQRRAKHTSKYRKIVSKKKVSQTTRGNETCLISEKRDIGPQMCDSVPLLSTDFICSNQGQSQGKVGNLLTQRCNKHHNSETNLQHRRWLPLGKKFADEAFETRHGLENDRLGESMILAEKLSRDEELCATGNRSVKTISNMYVRDSNSENVYAEETMKTGSQLQMQENSGNRSCVNVWTQDTVFTYVEEELKNLRENRAPVNVSNRISEEVFHFIEMELRRLNAEVSLNSTPLTQGKISDYTEMLKTPEDKVSSLSWSFKDTKQSCSDCESKVKCPKFRQCVTSSSDEECSEVRGKFNAKGLCSTTYTDLLMEQNVLKGQDNISISNENVLCMRHLHEFPGNLMQCNASPMKTPVSNSFLSYPVKFETFRHDHNGCESQASQATTGCFSNMFPSTKDNCIVDETQEKGSVDEICSKKVERTNNGRLRLHQNKRMKKERRQKAKKVKGKKSKKVNKHAAYKMRKREKPNISECAWDLRQSRTGSNNAHSHLSLRESKIKPFAKGKDYLLHCRVPSRSRNIAKLDKFSKGLCETQFDNGKKFKSNQTLFSTEAQYSAPCQSVAPLATFDQPPETPDYGRPAPRFVQSHGSESRCPGSGTRYRQMLSNSYDVDAFKVEDVGPYLCFVNQNGYSTSCPLPICTWMPPLFDSRNSFLKNESCKQICKPVHQKVTPTPWPEILFSGLPSSGINDVQILDSFISHDPSNQFPPCEQICGQVCPISSRHSSPSKSDLENIKSNYILSMRCKYLPDSSSCGEELPTRLYTEDIPTKTVTHNGEKNEDYKCATKVVSSNSTKNPKRQSLKIKTSAVEKNDKLNNVKDDCMQEMCLQTCGGQMVTRAVDLSLPTTKPISIHIKVRTGGNAGESGESRELSCESDNEHTDQKNTARIIQVRTRPLPDEFKLEICGPEISTRRCPENLYAMEHGKTICTNIKGEPVKDTLPLKSKCRERFPRQIGSNYKKPSYSLDHSCDSIASDKISKDTSVSNCLEEHAAGNSLLECTLENTTCSAFPYEQTPNIISDETNRLVLPNEHRIQCIKTDAGSNNGDKTDTECAITLSSVVVKEASKWKFLRYHPYILPKKRQLGMFRIAKMHQINNNNEVNKIINISKEYNCISANELVNNGNNLCTSPSVGTEANRHDTDLRTPYPEATGRVRDPEHRAASLPQSLEYFKVASTVFSKTFEDGEIGLNTNSQTENGNKNNINVLREVSENISKSSRLFAEESASLKDLLITTQCNTPNLLANSNFIRRPSDSAFNIFEGGNLSVLQEFGENSGKPQIFQEKSRPIKDEHCWLEKPSETGNISVNKNGDGNESTEMEISSLQSDEHQQEPPLPLESIGADDSPSLLETKLIDKTVSPSSVVRQGAHFKLIHKIAPCVLRPHQLKVISQADSCILPKAKKRRRIIVLNKNNLEKQHRDDVCTASPSPAVLESCANNKSVSLSQKSDNWSLGNNASPSKTHGFKDCEGISDVSSSDEEPVESHNNLDYVSSVNVDANVNIDLNGPWLGPVQDSVLDHGANTVGEDRSVSASLASPSCPRNVLPSSDHKIFVTAIANNVEARLGSKDSAPSKVLHYEMGHSPAINNAISEKVENVMDETYFNGIQSNEGIFPEFEREFLNIYGETCQKAVEILNSSSPNNLGAVFMERNVLSAGVNSFNSCIYQLPLNESGKNTPDKSSAFNCQLFAPQEHAGVEKLEETNLLNHLNFIDEESGNNLSTSPNKTVLLNSETSAMNISLVNNSTTSKSSNCEIDKSLKIKESSLRESEPFLNKLHPENVLTSSNIKSLPKLVLLPENNKFESPSRKDSHTEEEDILDLALRTDLYELITLGNGTMYSWPQIEESTESPVSQHSKKTTDKDLVDKMEAMEGTDSLCVYGNLNFEKRPKPLYQEDEVTNEVTTQDSQSISGRSTEGLTMLDTMGSYSKNAETVFFLDNNKSSKLLNTFGNAHSCFTIEGDAEELKGDAEELKGDAEELKGDAEELKGDAEELKGDAEELKGDAEELKGDAEELKGDAEELKGDAEELKGDAEELKGDAEELKGDAEELKGDAEELTGDAGVLTGDAGVLTGDAEELTGDAGVLTGDAEELKEDAEGLEKKVKNLSASAFYLSTHADQLPFRCEFCGRLFKHKRSRDRHVKLHTGDKKYKCCHCEAAFSRSDHLKIHKKTHDTQKPYQCTICNRGYNTAAALTAHMQNHKTKLTAHALNQLLKDAQARGEAHVLSQLLRDSSGDAHTQTLNHLLKDTQKEQLLSPRRLELGAGSSPGDLTASPVGEPSPTLSPVATVRCPVCHAHCRNPAHLQRHLSRYHGDEIHTVAAERPASRGGGSGASSIGGASSAASTPSPRPPSSLPSPRPLPNPLLSLVGGKLACIYCSRDGFPSLEALQLHLQSAHGSALNGEVRDMAAMLGLPSSLGTSLGASGLTTSLASPLGPGSSRGVSCELCGARVGGVTALQRHVVTAHTFTDLLARAAEGVFCAQCLLPFSNPGALAEHIKLVHTAPVLSAVLNKRPPSPPTDKPTDLSKKSRHENLTSDLPASTLLCSQCNAPFTNFEAFRRHLKSHLDGGEQLSSTMAGAVQLACPECRLPLTSETSLEAHLATHLGITSTEYGCQACLKLFSKPDELQKHLMDIHAHHLYRCALCKDMFDSKVSIQVHFAVKHSNECKVNKCTRCSIVFRSQSEFEGHIRVSHMRRSQSGGDPVSGSGSVGGSGGSYRCLLCTLTLSSEAELAAHLATHQRQFQCSLCEDAFYVEFLLDKHMQTQHNSELNGNIPQPENLVKPRRSPQKKDLRCDICDAEFSTDSGLLNHRKQAHNIKSGSGGMAAKVAAASLSLFCAYCSEACKSRGDLEAHMKSHQGNGGRHKCNICDELCPSAALLAQHKLTHVKVVSGSACAVCREPLTSEQQFTNHQNEHHQSPLPQPCVVCRQTLVTDMEVTVHARFHAAQAAQAAAAASVTSGIFSSGELLPPSSNSSIITTAATLSTITTNSNGSSRSSSSPRHSPSLRCPECHIKLETIEEAEAHAAAHHQQHHQKPQQQQQQQQGFGRSLTSSSRTYQCIKCQESFASEAEIEAHVASHLLHEGSVHECHLCRATFDTPLRLQCHLIEHTFEGCGSFTCYMCSSVFTTASRLQQHMVEHGLSARPYDCHHCHQRFFFRAELENHALSHPEAADGGCRECLASFPDLPRRNLRRPSLSCLTSAQQVGSHMTQNRANCDMGLQRPTSPYTACTGDETDAGPANGHATSVTDVKDE
nr:uncharacterized protein LOC123762251 [Procambarus clarkii]